jgi:hypothetical protein
LSIFSGIGSQLLQAAHHPEVSTPPVSGKKPILGAVYGHDGKRSRAIAVVNIPMIDTRRTGRSGGWGKFDFAMKPKTIATVPPSE